MNKPTSLFLVFLAFTMLFTFLALGLHNNSSSADDKEEDIDPRYHVVVRNLSSYTVDEPEIDIEIVNSVETTEITVEAVVEDSVEIEYSGVLNPSNLTAEELEVGLLYNLKDYSEAFIKAEQVTGINAIFLASVAALESGWGRSDLALYQNNLYGWTSSQGYCYFNSYDDCILKVAENLKNLYLQSDGIYFSGYEVSDINKHYNGSKFWEDSVQDIMTQIQNRIGG